MTNQALERVEEEKKVRDAGGRAEIQCRWAALAQLLRELQVRVRRNHLHVQEAEHGPRGQ